MKSMEQKSEQKSAIFAVFKAVRNGTLIRPLACSVCGGKPPKTKNGRSRIQGHHHNGYSKEHQIDVQWLCPPCHKGIHPNDQEARTRTAIGNKGKKRSMESREKQSKSKRGITGTRAGWTPERKERQRQKMLEHWSNPENRNAQSKAIRKSWESRVV